jgi:hypothetical protein
MHDSTHSVHNCLLKSWRTVSHVSGHAARSLLLHCPEPTADLHHLLGGRGPLLPRWRPFSQDLRTLPPYSSWQSRLTIWSGRWMLLLLFKLRRVIGTMSQAWKQKSFLQLPSIFGPFCGMSWVLDFFFFLYCSFPTGDSTVFCKTAEYFLTFSSLFLRRFIPGCV